MSDAPPVLRVTDLAIGFDKEPLLEHLTFEVRHGEVFAILGASGSGKSTLLRHLIGLARPLSGSVEFSGTKAALRVDRPPPFGVTFQSGALFGSMTLLENVALPLEKWTRLSQSAIAAVARGRLRLVGLGGYENHLPAEVSGGMKKRAAIARALALEPEILFLDEPSAGLDPVTATELDRLLVTFQKSLGMTIVVVTHDLDSIFRIADRCVLLDNRVRGIVAEGSPEELARSSDARVGGFFRRTTRRAAMLE